MTTRDSATVSAYRKPIQYTQISQLSLQAAVGIWGGAMMIINNTPFSPGYAVVQCVGTAGTDSVRWRDDGTAPTSSLGMTLAAGQELDYSGDISQIQFINSTGTGAALNVSLYV